MTAASHDNRQSDVLLIGCVPPPIGGVSQHVWRLAQKLVEDGFKTQVLDTHPAPGKYAVPGADLKQSPHYKILKAPWLIREIRRQPRAVAHFQYSLLRSPRSLDLLLNACPSGQRKVLTLHHGDLQAHFAKLSRVKQRCYRKVLGRFDSILSLSPLQKAFYREQGGVPESRIIDSSSLLHLSQELIDSIHRSSSPDPWGDLPSGIAHRIVTSGYPYPDYWYAETIELVDRLQEAEPTALALCLYGPKTPHLNELEELAASRPYVKIFWGMDFIPFMQLLAASSLYVRPAVKDSYGLAVADAASIGISVVASDVCPRDPRAIRFPTGSEDAFMAAVQSAFASALGSPDLSSSFKGADDAYDSIIGSYGLRESHRTRRRCLAA